MNKVVCYVCGTSYPENAAQCPICGYVQTAEKNTSANSGDSTYTYVKGGRFSKANVKKRSQAKMSENPAAPIKKNSGKYKEKSNAGAIIIIVILLLAIIAVAGYIALRFFIPNDFIYEGLGNMKLPSANQETEPPATDPATEPIETEPPTVSLECTSVQIDTTTVELEGIGSTFKLNVSLEPADTQDPVSYTSSDDTVASVSNDGTITVVGEGTAVITVTCGSVSADCTVVCTDPEAVIVELTLNRKEITFNSEGQSWLLYDGDIPAEEIIWTSDDNSVAAIEGGKVVAIGNGDTVVYGIYNDQTVGCVIHCKFDEESEEGSSNISEAAGDSSKTYSLYNPYGYADDVTMNPGEVFTLKLVDENLNDADDVEWKVKDENICSFNDNIVEAKNSGMTEITATCAGKTYTCVVRVN